MGSAIQKQLYVSDIHPSNSTLESYTFVSALEIFFLCLDNIFQIVQICRRCYAIEFKIERLERSNQEITRAWTSVWTKKLKKPERFCNVVRKSKMTWQMTEYGDHWRRMNKVKHSCMVTVVGGDAVNGYREH